MKFTLKQTPAVRFQPIFAGGHGGVAEIDVFKDIVWTVGYEDGELTLIHIESGGKPTTLRLPKNWVSCDNIRHYGERVAE